jgi:hypothetical protein
MLWCLSLFLFFIKLAEKNKILPVGHQPDGPLNMCFVIPFLSEWVLLYVLSCSFLSWALSGQGPLWSQQILPMNCILSIDLYIWTILASQKWNQVDYGVYPFQYIVEFALRLFYWEILYLCLPSEFVYDFIYFISYWVLVLG